MSRTGGVQYIYSVMISKTIRENVSTIAALFFLALLLGIPFVGFQINRLVYRYGQTMFAPNDQIQMNDEVLIKFKHPQYLDVNQDEGSTVFGFDRAADRFVPSISVLDITSSSVSNDPTVELSDLIANRLPETKARTFLEPIERTSHQGYDVAKTTITAQGKSILGGSDVTFWTWFTYKLTIVKLGPKTILIYRQYLPAGEQDVYFGLTEWVANSIEFELLEP